MKESSRIYRTEVIWKPEPIEDEDPEDSCPIDCNIFVEWGNKLINSIGGSLDRRKKFLVFLSTAAFAVLIMVAGITSSVSKSSVNSVYELKSLSWNGLTQNGYNPDTMHEISLLHLENAIPLPDIIDNNIANVDEPLQNGDVTYFFHIPRTAGASVKDVSGPSLSATISGIVHMAEIKPL